MGALHSQLPAYELPNISDTLSPDGHVISLNWIAISPNGCDVESTAGIHEHPNSQLQNSLLFESNIGAHENMISAHQPNAGIQEHSNSQLHPNS